MLKVKTVHLKNAALDVFFFPEYTLIYSLSAIYTNSNKDLLVYAKDSHISPWNMNRNADKQR